MSRRLIGLLLVILAAAAAVALSIATNVASATLPKYIATNTTLIWLAVIVLCIVGIAVTGLQRLLAQQSDKTIEVPATLTAAIQSKESIELKILKSYMTGLTAELERLRPPQLLEPTDAPVIDSRCRLTDPSVIPPQPTYGSWSSFISSIRNHDTARYVLLGGPGTGKSYLLRHYAADLLNSLRRRIDSKPHSKVRTDDDQVKVPIFLSCAELANELSNGTVQGDIIEAIARALHAQIPIASIDQIVLRLQRWYQTGDVVLLLDGLDEVGEVGQYTALKRSLSRLSANIPSVHIIVSSRPTSSTPAGFLQLELLDPDYEQVRGYVSQRLDGNPDSTTKILQLQVTGRQTTPLVLSWLCSLHMMQIPMPSTLSELYDKIIHLLLSARWRADTTRIPDEALVQQLISTAGQVALKAAESNKGWQEHISTKEISSLPNGQLVISSLCRGDAALLVRMRSIEDDEQSTNLTYRFYHRTIQEFLVARSISIKQRNEWRGTVKLQLWNEAWVTGVFPFLAEMLGQHLLELLVELAKKDPACHQALVLAAQVCWRARIKKGPEVAFLYRGLERLCQSTRQGDLAAAALVAPRIDGGEEVIANALDIGDADLDDNLLVLALHTELSQSYDAPLFLMLFLMLFRIFAQLPEVAFASKVAAYYIFRLCKPDDLAGVAARAGLPKETREYLLDLVAKPGGSELVELTPGMYTTHQIIGLQRRLWLLKHMQPILAAADSMKSHGWQQAGG